MLKIDISRGMKTLRRDLNDLERKQVPFASALALTRIAQNVAKAEVEQLGDDFDSPTPFTKKGVAIIPATKSRLTSTVYIRDIQSEYLLPYKDGGLQVLKGKRAMLAPRGVPVNSYGNLPRTKLATLKGQANVFVGKVKTKKGREVGGVWRRVGKGAKERLKLLIEFTAPQPVHQHLDFEGRAREVVEGCYQAEFAAALDRALATSR